MAEGEGGGMGWGGCLTLIESSAPLFHVNVLQKGKNDEGNVQEQLQRNIPAPLFFFSSFCLVFSCFVFWTLTNLSHIFDVIIKFTLSLNVTPERCLLLGASAQCSIDEACL